MELTGGEDNLQLVLPPQFTISQMNELIGILDKTMDEFLVSDSIEVMRNSEKANISTSQDSHLMAVKEVWDLFLEYCHQNELDPAQQLREAVASYYQDVLKSYRIRSKLALRDTPNLV